MAESNNTARVRERQCPACGARFTYLIARGADRRFCSDGCVRRAAAERRHLRPMGMCSVPGCGNDANRARLGLCEKHYMRQRRNGTTERLVPKQRYGHVHGYVKVRCLGHPLVKGRASPVEYEHRVVFYNARGAGPFRCQHCGVEVTWADMHVDHLNDTPDDNRIENLAPSCPKCNWKRGRPKMAASVRRQHASITAFGRTLSISEWAREVGISSSALKERIQSGWSLERALSEPRGRFGPKSRREAAMRGASAT